MPPKADLEETRWESVPWVSSDTGSERLSPSQEHEWRSVLARERLPPSRWRQTHFTDGRNFIQLSRIQHVIVTHSGFSIRHAKEEPHVFFFHMETPRLYLFESIYKSPIIFFFHSRCWSSNHLLCCQNVQCMYNYCFPREKLFKQVDRTHNYARFSIGPQHNKLSPILQMCPCKVWMLQCIVMQWSNTFLFLGKFRSREGEANHVPAGLPCVSTESLWNIHGDLLGPSSPLSQRRANFTVDLSIWRRLIIHGINQAARPPPWGLLQSRFSIQHNAKLIGIIFK